MKLRRIFLILSLLLLIITAYLLFYPVNIKPVAWNPPISPSLEKGIYQKNNQLDGIKHLKVSGIGPEDIAMDDLGRIYAGLEDGRIIRLKADGSDEKNFADTKGRPLGLKFDKAGNLIVADAYKGLLAIDKSGKITVLATEYAGLKFNFTDDLDIAEEGTIYFSDASSKFNFHDKIAYPLESGATGRLLSYNPQSKETKLLLDKLYFANGVALSPDQSFVLVNETLRYRITRFWLKGEKKGQSDVFIENLPGFPDGILHNGKDIYWVSIVNPRNKILDDNLPRPFVRKILARLPAFLLPAPIDYGFVLGLDNEGKVVYNLQDTKGNYGQITNVLEYQNQLYFGSLHEKAIGLMPKPAR